MPSIISKETRILWRRRIKGFWEEFGRKKIGIAGLILLLFFVFMAIFSPWLTPYDPLGAERVADGFALPQWMTIFPQYQKLPLTDKSSLDWYMITEYPYIIWGRNVTVTYKAKSIETVDIQLNSIFTYTEEISPNTFYIDFIWSTEEVQDIEYTIRLSVVNPKNERFLLYFTQKEQVAKGEVVHVDSINPLLMYRLGLSPGVDILGNIIFLEKGDYEFFLDIHLKATTPSATCNINFRDARLVTLGQVHGILGADNAGADVFAQLVWGARISLMIGIMAAVISTFIGILVGIATGYLGGIVDELMMRIVDILLCLPILPLLLTLVFLFGKSVFYIVLFVAVFGWQGLARIIRSQVLSLRENAFIESAKASGASKSYIMLKHLLPNVLPIAFASMVLSVPAAILFEAALSFLGFGDPRVPTWGKMLHDAFGFGGFTSLAWWWILPPGLAITFLCLAFVFMGHAIDEVVNPRLRRRR